MFRAQALVTRALSCRLSDSLFLPVLERNRDTEYLSFVKGDIFEVVYVGGRFWLAIDRFSNVGGVHERPDFAHSG
jgi:hypothetical protein